MLHLWMKYSGNITAIRLKILPLKNLIFYFSLILYHGCLNFWSKLSVTIFLSFYFLGITLHSTSDFTQPKTYPDSTEFYCYQNSRNVPFCYKANLCCIFESREAKSQFIYILCLNKSVEIWIVTKRLTFPYCV